MLSTMVMVVLALFLLGTATPAADGGFIPALLFLVVAVVTVHVTRLRRPVHSFVPRRAQWPDHAGGV